MGDLTNSAEGLPSHHPVTVLVVDDDIPLLGVTAAMLNSEGYRVFKAGGAAEAVKVFEQRRSEIDLLLSDVLMPGMTGLELEKQIHLRKPDLPVIFMTGTPSQAAVEAQVLAKPFSMHELFEKVAGALVTKSETM